MKKSYLAVLPCLLLLQGSVSGTLITYSSGSNFISSPLVSSTQPVVIAQGTANVAVLSTVEGNAAGTDSTDPALLAQGSASVSVVGGTLLTDGSGGFGTKPRSGIRLLDDSSLTMLSGLIEGAGSGSSLDRAGILAEGNSQVTVLGGSVVTGGTGNTSNSYAIRALGNSQVSILGGTITAILYQQGFAATVLSAVDNARFTIFGSNFNFPDGAISPLSGTLTGKLKDGTSINWSFTHTATSSITLVTVPEPSSLVLLLIAVGAFGFIALRA